MLDDVKKRAVIDVLAWPWSLGPTVFGMMGLLAAWANDGPTGIFLGGVALVLAGVGITLSRFALGLDRIMENAWEGMQADERKKKKQYLLDLRNRMEVDADARTTKALDRLMTVYAEFVTNIKEQHVPITSRGVLVEKIDQLFDECVRQLERSLELHKTQASLRGAAKASVKAQREREVKDVVDGIDQMERVIADCITLAVGKGNTSNVTALSDEMSQIMNVASRTEERLREMGISEGPEPRRRVFQGSRFME